MPEKPKRPAGRPFGTYKDGEKKSKTLGVALTPTAYNWIKKQPKGWLTNFIETKAREPRA